MSAAVIGRADAPRLFFMLAPTVDIVGVPIAKIGVEEAATAIARVAWHARGADASEPQLRHCDSVCVVCTPNAEILMTAQRDAALMEALRESGMTLADGAGVVLAARILRLGKIPRAPGFDTACRLLEGFPGASPLRFYFLGGAPGIAEAAASTVSRRYPRAIVVGARDGYFEPNDEQGIVSAINDSGADILFVALGAPKQELWMRRHRQRLRVAACMGVGGTLDVLAGKAQLAPAAMRRLGLEWLYRLLRQPSRAGRMLKLPQFVLLAVRWRLFGAPRGKAADRRQCAGRKNSPQG